MNVRMSWMALGLLLLAANWLPAAELPARPNILVILCDDLGYGDLGCFGHPRIKTPHLDKLAAEGIKLTSCYASAPVCSASRAGLLTGRTPTRIGVYDWIPNNHPMHLTKDIGEANDIAAQHPDVVERLSAQMKQAYTPSERWKFKQYAVSSEQ